MIAKGLKMEGDKILGAEDFVTAYSADNADAFIEEYDPGEDDLGGDDEVVEVPHFVESTPGAPAPQNPNGGFDFHFTGVRPIPGE